MALSVFRNFTLSSTKYIHRYPMLWIGSCDTFQVRHRNHRELPKTKKWKKFLNRHTDFIKHLCISLVKHERVFTTMNKAIQLQEYGDLVRYTAF